MAGIGMRFDVLASGVCMRRLAGADRRALSDELLAVYDQVAAGQGPLVVSLEGLLGLGKTRLVQELYERLAAGRQGRIRYWPLTLDRTAAESGAHVDVLQARKVIEPAGWVIPGGAEIPWLWWAISCHLGHAGNPMRAMQDASGQLPTHLDPIRQRLARSNQNQQDALELLGGLFDLAGVVNPGSALDAGKTVVKVFQRRIRQAFAVDPSSMDRRVDTHGEGYAEAARVATSLQEVARAGVPVILVVDDAQWADPALVSLLRYLSNVEAARVLIVATSWADHDRSGSGPAESFGSWLEALSTSLPDRVRRFELAPLGDDGLGEMVRSVAPRTDPDAVRRIGALSGGNPLMLSLLLDLDLIREDIAADGRIDTDPERLRRMPSNLQAIYQDLWRQLPRGVQRLLVLVSVQGQEFLPGSVEAASSRLGMHDELSGALLLARDRYHWVRAVNDVRWEFTEPQRHQVAFDRLHEVFSAEQLGLIRAEVMAHAVELKSSPRWADVDLRTRRLVLEGHLEAGEDLGGSPTAEPAQLLDSALQLAALELDGGDPRKAVELVEGALSSMGPATPPAALDRARDLLAQSLVATGRAAEAVPLLAASGEAAAAAEVRAAAAAATPKATMPTGRGRDEWGRRPWVGWSSHPVAPLPDMPPSELGVLVCEVVGVEGPVYAGRVYGLLRAASGASRQNAAIRAALDAAVRSVSRRGQLVVSAPEVRGRPDLRVLRLPNQEDIVLRTPGDREPADVPRREIAQLARLVAAGDPGLSRDALKRRIGGLLGQGKMTRALDDLLEAAIPDLAAEVAADADRTAAPDEWGRIPWVGWEPVTIPPLSDLKPAEIGSWIERIVEAEGPVVAGRVFVLAARASGAPRLSAAVTGALEGGLAAALRRGGIVVAPGRRGSPETRTLRLATQPEAVPRLAGARALAEIPRAELKRLAERVGERHPDWDAAAVRREVARLAGVGRYTDAADRLLGWALG